MTEPAPPRRLFTPGPTELPAQVMHALARPLSPARAPEFVARMKAVSAQLRRVFDTAGAVATLTASGTGAMEAAFVNLVRPGDRVLVAHAGKFGERWLALARAYGITAHELKAPWGERLEPAALADALARAPGVSLVCLTHSETSTGVVHDVEALARVVREAGDALVLVDAVSSAGAVALHLDRWALDACVAASHKGLLCPPGLAFAALGPRALVRVGETTLPRFYFDLRPALDGLADGGTPWTPAISLVHALSCSLERLLDDGLEAAWRRTARLARATRAGVAAGGLALYPEHPGDVLSAVRTPPGIDARQVVTELRRLGFEVAGGQEAIRRSVLRIAHLGAIADADLLALMDALGHALRTLGAAPPAAGAMRRAAAAALAPR